MVFDKNKIPHRITMWMRKCDNAILIEVNNSFFSFAKVYTVNVGEWENVNQKS